ncbi:hypothetical protein SAMN05444858_101120 [Micromonospora avicenniae]|uniref:Uncharacterized protein n=1 Tax=Micromonospora avicenniae TaxID=1198245 RepID=A0A1N6Q121_9ACTN|nr:hypothetical protein SAMN05444858_101120 [Micromonospora avicenniae]
MKAHRTDLVSFAFGLLFLALTAWWLSAKILGLAVPPAGWFLAGALILIGVFGLVGALRSGRHADREAATDDTAPVGDAPAAQGTDLPADGMPIADAGLNADRPVSGVGHAGWYPDQPTSGGILPGWEPDPPAAGRIHPAWQVDRTTEEIRADGIDAGGGADTTATLDRVDATTTRVERTDAGAGPDGGDERPTEAVTGAPGGVVEDRPEGGSGGVAGSSSARPGQRDDPLG